MLARAKWVDGLVVYLADGKVANVIQRLKRLQRAKSSDLYEEIRRGLDYLEEHRSRMHDPRDRAANMTIGSGAIESIHKWVIQARCKLSRHGVVGDGLRQATALKRTSEPFEKPRNERVVFEQRRRYRDPQVGRRHPHRRGQLRHVLLKVRPRRQQKRHESELWLFARQLRLFARQLWLFARQLWLFARQLWLFARQLRLFGR